MLMLTMYQHLLQVASCDWCAGDLLQQHCPVFTYWAEKMSVLPLLMFYQCTNVSSPSGKWWPVLSSQIEQRCWSYQGLLPQWQVVTCSVFTNWAEMLVLPMLMLQIKYRRCWCYQCTHVSSSSCKWWLVLSSQIEQRRCQCDQCWCY